MANWTLLEIRNKVRQTTGRPDASMMSDATINDYINKVYQFVLPKELKIFWGYTYYTFFTTPGVAQYAGPTTSFQTLNPQAWVDGFPLEWYISPDLFYQDYPAQLNRQVVATGDGTTLTYTFSVSAFPIIPGSLYVTDGAYPTTTTAQDNGAGGFVAPNSGSIDYTTGAVSVTTTVPFANNADITVVSAAYVANRPQGILYFPAQPLADSDASTRNDRMIFDLRPVPDQTYQVRIQGIQIPKPLNNDGQVPFREDMGPLIAYAASLEIFADYNQMDQYDQALVQFNRYKDVSMQDTYEELLYQRSVPIF